MYSVLMSPTDPIRNPERRVDGLAMLPEDLFSDANYEKLAVYARDGGKFGVAGLGDDGTTVDVLVLLGDVAVGVFGVRASADGPIISRVDVHPSGEEGFTAESIRRLPWGAAMAQAKADAYTFLYKTSLHESIPEPKSEWIVRPKGRGRRSQAPTGRELALLAQKYVGLVERGERKAPLA